MKTKMLLAATAVIALTGASAMAAPALASPFHHSPAKQVLYNQNSNPSFAYVNSQNDTGGDTQYNDQAADDFVVPAGQTWKVTEVDVTGCCAYTTSITENVFFYKDKNGVPGRLVRNGSFLNLNGTGNPSFAMSLGTGVRLKAGHYWVSVVVNCDYETGCGWGWGETSTISNDAALWENPGNGHTTGCTTWTALGTCLGSAYTGDLMFELQGRSK